MKHPLLILTLLALGGCAGTYTEPTLPADHPANAATAELPPMMHSRTLDLAADEPRAPKSSVPGMETGAHKHEMPSSSALLKPEGNAAAALYACPMHPEVTSDKPDQRCPKCGMKLVKQNGGKQP